MYSTRKTENFKSQKVFNFAGDFVSETDDLFLLVSTEEGWHILEIATTCSELLNVTDYILIRFALMGNIYEKHLLRKILSGGNRFFIIVIFQTSLQYQTGLQLSVFHFKYRKLIKSDVFLNILFESQCKQYDVYARML